MTPLQITLAVVGGLLIISAASLLVYTVWALLTGRRTVSGWMKHAGQFIVFVIGFATGFLIGGMAAHWWWPTVGG